MMTSLLILALSGAAFPLQGSATSPSPALDGRCLRAYEVAAREIEHDEHASARWRNVDSYTVVFEGEKEGDYVIHFLPKGPPVVKPGTDFDPRNGLPLRMYVRKKDLKFVKGVVE